MKTKICQNCGAEFEIKRSNAKFCSDKCKNDANYSNRKQVKEKTQSTVLNNSTANLKLIGDVDFKNILKITERLENEIERINSVKTIFENEIITLDNSILDLLEKINKINQNQIPKLYDCLNLSDLDFYNHILNKAHKEALNKSDINAHEKLLKLFDYNSSNEGYKYQNPVSKTRLDFKLKINNLRFDVENLHNEIDKLNKSYSINQSKIKELLKDIRFYQLRIQNYEALLFV